MANEVEIRVTAENDASRTLRGVGEDLDRVGDSSRRASGRVDSFGNSAGEADGAAMGFRDSVTGVQDSFRGFNDDSLTTQERLLTLGMGFGDLASGVENFGVRGVRAFGSFKRFVVRNAGAISVGAGAAGLAIAAIGMAIQRNRRREQEATARTEEYVDALEKVEGNSREAGARTLALSDSYQDLRDWLDAANVSTEDLTGAIRDGELAQMDFSGMNFSAMVQMNDFVDAMEEGDEQYESTQGAIEGTTEALRDHADAVRAQFDPLFAMLDAQARSRETQVALEEAQSNLNTAIREHGLESNEAREARNRLTEAENNARDSVVNLEGAATDLRIAVQEGSVQADQARQDFINMAEAQGFSAQEARTMAADFGFATDEAARLGGSDPDVNVSHTGAGWGTFNNIRQSVLSIPKQATVNVQARGSAFGISGMAHGGIGSGPTIVGERGPELVNLGAGGSVAPNANTEQALANAGRSGGPNVTINVQGSILSERDLVEIVRDEMRRGGFGGVR